MYRYDFFVMRLEAGIPYFKEFWMPACADMTDFFEGTAYRNGLG
jgi:hypothetical protein